MEIQREEKERVSKGGGGRREGVEIQRRKGGGRV